METNIVFETDFSIYEAFCFEEIKWSLKSSSNGQKRSVRNAIVKRIKFLNTVWKKINTLAGIRKKIVYRDSRLISKNTRQTTDSLKNGYENKQIFNMIPEIWLPNER